MLYNLDMTNQKQELSFQQQIKNKRQEIVNYEGVLERYRTGPSHTNRWYNMGRRNLEALQDELKVLKGKRKRQVRLNLCCVRRRAEKSRNPVKLSKSISSIKRTLTF